MMKGKLMKSLFRGKGGVPRTPGGPVSNEGDEVSSIIEQYCKFLNKGVANNISLNTTPLSYLV